MFTIFIVLFFIFKNDKYTYVKINNGNGFYICKNDNMEKAYNMLNYIVSNCANLCDELLSEELPNKNIATRLYNRFNHATIYEICDDDNSRGFAINKGDEIKLKLKKQNGIYYTYEQIMYVLLHEMAHLMSVSYGHNEEFYSNFNFIVDYAYQNGYYKN
tara:strand:+ start:799 stop:1275 length:477 start_codon:yes stop_codon:yes gene_type:complete